MQSIAIGEEQHLPRNKSPSLELNRVKWASTSKDCMTLYVEERKETTGSAIVHTKIVA